MTVRLFSYPHMSMGHPFRRRGNTQRVLCMNITQCPPMPAHQILKSEPIFFDRRTVAHLYQGRDSSLSFVESREFRTTTLKKSGGRKLPTPEWAMGDECLRQIITRSVELRAGFRFPQSGTFAERLARADDCLRARVPAHTETLKRLCGEHMAESEPSRKKVLELQIRTLDAAILVNRRAAGVIAHCVYAYYRKQEAAPEIAADLGIKPGAVRQILWRVRRLVRLMEGGEPATATREDNKRRWRRKNQRKKARAEALARVEPVPTI
jgi:hypothetical protein